LLLDRYNVSGSSLHFLIGAPFHRFSMEKNKLLRCFREIASQCFFCRAKSEVKLSEFPLVRSSSPPLLIKQFSQKVCQIRCLHSLSVSQPVIISSADPLMFKQVSVNVNLPLMFFIILRVVSKPYKNNTPSIIVLITVTIQSRFPQLGSIRNLKTYHLQDH